MSRQMKPSYPGRPISTLTIWSLELTSPSPAPRSTRFHLPYPTELSPYQNTRPKALTLTRSKSYLLWESRAPWTIDDFLPKQDLLVLPVFVLQHAQQREEVSRVGVLSFRFFLEIYSKHLIDNGISGAGSQRHPHPLAALPLHELLEHLTPQEVSFFTMLDAQLDKVESFYIAREKEMLDRSYLLQMQLNELNDHRKLFYVRP